MQERSVTCFAEPQDALPIRGIRPGATLDAFPQACGFTGARGQTVLLPGPAGAAGGLDGALVGLGDGPLDPGVFAGLPACLPAGAWRLAEGIEEPDLAVLGWGLGAYRYDVLKQAPHAARPVLVLPDGSAATLSAVRACWLARDLVNTPANRLGPASLAACAAAALEQRGAHVDVIAGAALEDGYPALHAVGAGATRPPCMLFASWAAPGVGPDAPLISLCGKGVCFDTGGYDIKPSAAMLRMKKDMGGAAVALGLACMIIEAGLPVRLHVRLGCAENMISGHAMRPGDVLRTRSGLSVEVGNTDAEGRLVLADLLTAACEDRPALLLDFATLTGAARTALGPDLPALFTNDDAAADLILQSGRLAHDPVWRLPLWDSYKTWLDDGAGDLNNVSKGAHAGAIVAALFLQRFVPTATRWAHFDVYAWNDTDRPGRPAGGECQAMRAAFGAVCRFATGFDAVQG